MPGMSQVHLWYLTPKYSYIIQGPLGEPSNVSYEVGFQSSDVYAFVDLVHMDPKCTICKYSCDHKRSIFLQYIFQYIPVLSLYTRDGLLIRYASLFWIFFNHYICQLSTFSLWLKPANKNWRDIENRVSYKYSLT